MTASEQHDEYAAHTQSSRRRVPTIGKRFRDAIEAAALRRVADQWEHRYGVSAFVSIDTLRAEADRIEEGAR